MQMWPMTCCWQVIEFSVSSELRSTCANSRIVVDEDMHHARVFYGTFFAFAFLVPLLAISLLYSAMIRRLLGHSVVGTRSDGKAKESMRAKRRVTRLVVIVVVIFAVCWLPMQVLITFTITYLAAVVKQTTISEQTKILELKKNKKILKKK